MEQGHAGPMRIQPKFSVCVARDRFLRAVADYFPKVLERLRCDVLPQFSTQFIIRPSKRNSIEQGTRSGVPQDFLYGPLEQYVLRSVRKEDLARLIDDLKHSHLGYVWSRDFVDSNDSKRMAIRDLLEKWGRTWHLDEAWIYEIAMDTMTCWLTRPTGPTRWQHSRSWGISADDAPPTLTIHEEWWFEPWSQFNRRIENQIDTYKRAIDAYHAGHGFDPDAIGNSPHHSEWLALFQVGKQSPDKIRAWQERTHGERFAESAITKGYTRLAKRISLRLRTKYLQLPPTS